MDEYRPDVFSPTYQRKVLFTMSIEMRTSDLPRLKPTIVIDVDDDDDE